MPRTFDGLNDDFVTATGALSGMTCGTVAVLFQLNATGVFQAMFDPHDSVGSFLGAIAINDFNSCEWFAGSSSIAITVTSGVWYLLVARKATGTATPRFSVYSYTAKAWTHANGSVSLGNWTAPGVSGSIKCTFEGTADWFNGNIAVRAAWANILPWAATSGGDLVLEAAGLQFSLMAWLNAAPSALWVFDQSDITQKVPDLSGGGANQSSLAGTAVGISPIPTFGYGADLFDLRTAPTTGAPPPIEGPENSSTMSGSYQGRR